MENSEEGNVVVLAREALDELFPGNSDLRNISVTYSGRFKGFNANVKYTQKNIMFALGKDWLDVSSEIKKGLMQHLFVKVLKRKDFNKTIEMDLYEKFVSNLGKYVPVESSDEELAESFNRINSEYFSGMLERPNLVWGQDSLRKLGHFEYATNTILISNIFRGEPQIMDYVMYHEMLHKKQGRKITKSGRSIHHDRKFHEEERKFRDKDAERKLREFVRKKRAKGIFKFW